MLTLSLACIGIEPYTVEALTPSTTITVTATQTNTKTALTTQTDLVTNTETVATTTTIDETTTAAPPIRTQGLVNGGFEAGPPLSSTWKLAQANNNPNDHFNVTLSNMVSAGGTWSMKVVWPPHAVEEGHEGIFVAWQKVILLSGGTYRLSLSVRHNEQGNGFAYTQAYFTTAATDEPFPAQDFIHSATLASVSRNEPYDEFATIQGTFTVVGDGQSAREGWVAVRVDATYNFFDTPIEFYVDDVRLELVSGP